MFDGFVVTRAQQTGCVWIIPQGLMGKLKINQYEPVTLHFGTSQVSVIVNQLLPTWTSSGNMISLSEDAVNSLKILENTIVSVQKMAHNEFRLGPVIGILTLNKLITGNKLGFYKRLSVINKHNGMLYVFSKQGINAEERTIKGYYYDHLHNIWIPGEFPFPDVVINKSYPNDYEIVTLFESVIGAKVFNKNSRINKMDFYYTLKKDPFLCDFVPETKGLTSFDDIAPFLERHQKAYLKPIDGMKGDGVICLKKTTGNLLECSYHRDNKEHSQILLSVDEVFNVTEMLSDNNRSYIVQQPIDSMKYKDCNFSIRTWAMKNGNGNWVMPGMYATLSCEDGFLTNISVDSTVIPLIKLFKKITPDLTYNKSQLLILLEDITLKTAEVLDKQFGPLEVLGFDIMLDINGKLWLIEANGNPGTVSVFKQKEYLSWPTKVYQYELSYATYLAGIRAMGQPKCYKLKRELPKLTKKFYNNRLKEDATLQTKIEEKAINTEIEEKAINTKIEEKIINAMIFVAKKTVQEVQELQITPLPGIVIENNGNQTNKIRFEACKNVKIEYQVDSDKLNAVGYIPVRLIYEGISVASGNDLGLFQEISVPFQSEVEIKGLQHTDDIQGKISIVSSDIPRVSNSLYEAAEPTAKLTVRLTFNCVYLITRRSLIAVPAREVEDIQKRQK